MKGSLNQNSYIAGFVLSLVLTLVAYSLVVNDLASGWTAIYIILTLAVLQLAVQVVFFLHLGREQKPRWNLNVMLFAVMVVVILVGGSLWIMHNMNYHHGHEKSPSESDTYIIKDEGFGQ